MHIIKACPECRKKNRFPIDRGKIKVTCSCGYSYIANPDDPDIYKNSEFDLDTKQKKQIKKKITPLLDKFKNTDYDEIKAAIIKSLYNLKYKIQNFKLLPSSEQRNLIILFIAFLFLIALIIFFINYFPSFQIQEKTI